jgi:hypothetical protein
MLGSAAGDEAWISRHQASTTRGDQATRRGVEGVHRQLRQKREMVWFGWSVPRRA